MVNFLPHPHEQPRSKRIVINVLSIVLFVTIMISVMVVLHDAPPSRQAAALDHYATRLEHAAINAHWQWRAEDKPSMILLIHYNEEGRETDRRPVRISHNGWPEVAASSKGCENLWQMLLNEPMRVDGFRVFGEYFSSDQPLDVRCRYRVASGDKFDYFVATGKTDIN